jgi:hypothetical protein
MFISKLSNAGRSLIAITAFVTSSILLVGAATPAFAQSAPAYRLAPVAALAASDTVVVRDVLWRCTEAGCSARAATSRPAIVCATAARKIGALSAFSANGRDFSAEELAECNKRAKTAN